MDPVSIVGIIASACSISSGIAKLFSGLETLRQKFEGARFLLNLLKGRLKVVQASLDNIASWTTEVQCSQQLCDALNISIDGCNAVVGCLNNYIGDLCRNDSHLGLADRGRYLWREDTIKEYIENLNSEILVLNLVLTCYHSRNLSEQKDLLQRKSSRQAIQTLSKDTISLQTRIDSRVESTLRSGWTGIEREFGFDNDIINTHVYRKSLAVLRRKESSKEAASESPHEHPTLSIDQSIEPRLKKSEPNLIRIQGRKSIDWLRRLFRRRSTPSSVQHPVNTIVDQPPPPLQIVEPPHHRTTNQEIPLSSTSQQDTRQDVVNLSAPVIPNRSRRFGTQQDPNKALKTSNRSSKNSISDYLAPALSRVDDTVAESPYSPLAQLERRCEQEILSNPNITNTIGYNSTDTFHKRRHNTTSNHTSDFNHDDGDESRVISKKDCPISSSLTSSYPYASSKLSPTSASPSIRQKNSQSSAAKSSIKPYRKIINTPIPQMEILHEEPVCHKLPTERESTSGAVERSSKQLKKKESNIIVGKREKLSSSKQVERSDLTESFEPRKLLSARSDKAQYQTKKLDVAHDGNHRQYQPEAFSNKSPNENEHRKMPGHPGESILNHRNDVQYSGLHRAASMGDRIGICNSLDEGVDINKAWPGSGLTALHCAARKGHFAAVEYLLDRGAAINAIDNNHHTALHHACALGRPGTVKTLALWSKSFSVEILEIADRHGHTALFMCQPEVDSVFCFLLLHLRADFRASDKEGSTPLHWYAYNGDVRKVDTLLKTGAPCEIKTKFGRTVFHSACCGGNVNVVTRLLEENVDIESEDRYLRRPLHNASYFGHLAIVKILLLKGASPFAKDDLNWTPLSLVRYKATESSDYKAISDLLLACMKRSERAKDNIR